MKRKKIKILLFVLCTLICSNAYAETLVNIYDIEPQVICRITRNASNNIFAMQGVYFFNRNNNQYAVYAGYNSNDTNPIVITLVDLDSGCAIVAQDGSTIMGHANDMTYNSDEGKFYVTSSDSTNKIYGFKINENFTIEIDEEPITANFRIGSFDYNNENHKYYSHPSDGTLYTFPSFDSSGGNYKKLSNFPLTYDNFENGQSTLVRQGMSCSNDNIYFARTISATESEYYNNSYVTVFSATTGEYKYTMHFSSDIINGHLEGVTVIGNKIYFGVNINDSNPKEQVFMVYDGIDQIEENYNSIIKKIELIVQDDISLLLNEEFNYGKIKIKKTYINGRTEVLDLNENNCQVIDFDKTKLGQQVITIRYDNVDYELNVTVNENNLKSNKVSDETSKKLDVEVSNTGISNYIYIGLGVIIVVIGVYIIVKKKHMCSKPHDK